MDDIIWKILVSIIGNLIILIYLVSMLVEVVEYNYKLNRVK